MDGSMKANVKKVLSENFPPRKKEAMKRRTVNLPSSTWEAVEEYRHLACVMAGKRVSLDSVLRSILDQAL